MNFYRLHLLALSLFLFTACSTKKIDKDHNTTIQSIQSTIGIQPSHNATTNTNNTNLNNTNITHNNIQEEYSQLSGDFAGNWKLSNFIDRMHTEHNFDYKYLYTLFSNAKDSNQFVEPCKVRDSDGNCIVETQPKGKWDRYRDMFVYERNIQRGITFWEEHEETLNRAYQEYGVLPEHIIGIIGIETAYGVNFGKKRVIDVLTTKGMLGDRREDFYTKQLEKFLIMTRDANLDASTLMGSNAGAMGYGQFIASSYLAFAIDFNGDGITDLWNAEDAIGSVANYFAKNGWNRNLSEVVTRAKYKGNRFKKLKTGFKTKYSQSKLRKKHGITARKKLKYRGPVSLIKLPKHAYDELWFGTHNFRVITTYNHSTFYGMAVYVLGQAVKARRYGS
ncbi:MAG: Membrane-bound lytic murein transglycosylase B precursor (EC [uncultured Sulfurovum sp.]|uniref:Membrane-bound lytic murein transglycosylase B (EC) n=1 Tax=uncultured Sulfurovum sp. TaxID=269237 RepID=A0A6S6SIZ2_9BACT|nr:MAG: Membrane-bound lytic murein transglycosylase B precursor (EC [uncultured Sulfurovum sp.]